jgi:hypothetical protein
MCPEDGGSTFLRNVNKLSHPENFLDEIRIYFISAVFSDWLDIVMRARYVLDKLTSMANVVKHCTQQSAMLQRR